MQAGALPRPDREFRADNNRFATQARLATARPGH
jgi:hypothetical protein